MQSDTKCGDVLPITIFLDLHLSIDSYCYKHWDATIIKVQITYLHGIASMINLYTQTHWNKSPHWRSAGLKQNIITARNLPALTCLYLIGNSRSRCIGRFMAICTSENIYKMFWLNTYLDNDDKTSRGEKPRKRFHSHVNSWTNDAAMRVRH